MPPCASSTEREPRQVGDSLLLAAFEHRGVAAVDDQYAFETVTSSVWRSATSGCPAVTADSPDPLDPSLPLQIDHHPERILERGAAVVG